MKGGFNKLIRNIVAGASDTEFEKVSLLAALPAFTQITNFNLTANRD
jgi:hypothetical protein